MFQGLKADAKPVPGKENMADYATEFPADIKITDTFLASGKQRFEIYCSACHGYAGQGDGLVNQRAMALNQSGDAAWTTAKSLHDPEVKDLAKNPVGRLFNTISYGRGTMGPYRAQITAEDRWAIVAYVKALQETGLPVSSVKDDADEAEATDEPVAEEAPKVENAEPAAEVTDPEGDKPEAPGESAE